MPHATPWGEQDHEPTAEEMAAWRERGGDQPSPPSDPPTPPPAAVGQQEEPPVTDVEQPTPEPSDVVPEQPVTPDPEPVTPEPVVPEQPDVTDPQTPQTGDVVDIAQIGDWQAVAAEQGGVLVEVAEDHAKGTAWWTLVASNGQTLATSETYDSKSNAVRAARHFAEQNHLRLLVDGDLEYFDGRPAPAVVNEGARVDESQEQPLRVVRLVQNGPYHQWHVVWTTTGNTQDSSGGFTTFDEALADAKRVAGERGLTVEGHEGE